MHCYMQQRACHGQPSQEMEQPYCSGVGVALTTVVAMSVAEAGGGMAAAMACPKCA